MKHRALLLVALLAVVFTSLALGRWLFAPAVWLAPVFLVRFVRNAPGKLALTGFVLIFTVATEIAFIGTVPLPTFAHIGMFTALSLVLGLVFVADRWIVRRTESFATTLTLPCGWAAYDFLTGRFSFNGSWGSIAYGLTEQLPVVQLASLGGWVILTFLVAWFGTMVNRIWEARSHNRPIRRDLVVAGIVFGAVLAFGIARPLIHDLGPSTPVALLAAQDTFQGDHLEEVWRYTRGLDLTDEQLQAARGQIADWQDRHFDMLDQALDAGAKLAVWAEVNAAFTTGEEADWLERAARLARDRSAHIGLGLAVFTGKPGAETRNRFVLFGPDGEQVWDYYKATRVPGDHQVVGDGTLPRADSDIGRLTGAICFDLDFPSLIRQAGAMDADVLIAPSNDWTEARGIHARMAVMRTIEQGFNLVRPTKDGISLISDPFGRVLGDLDTDTGPETVLRGDVPSRGVTTLYSRIGDTFGWLSVAGFAMLVFGRLARRPSVVTVTLLIAGTGVVVAGAQTIFPEVGEPVTISTDGISLNGSLLLPAGDGPFPAVVGLVGSGAYTYRDAWIDGHWAFWKELADELGQQKIAVLLLEKRGVNGSEGSWKKRTLQDRADDALTAVDYLKQHDDIDADRIGLAGQSQGGWVAVIAAAAAPEDVDFLITFAGPTVPVLEQVVDDRESELRCEGLSGEKIRIKRAKYERKLRRHGGFGHLSVIGDYDPAADLRRVRQPMLAIFAEHDELVWPEKNLRLLEQAFAESGNERLWTHTVAGANHAFLYGKRCEPLKGHDGPPAFRDALLTPAFFSAFRVKLLDR